MKVCVVAAALAATWLLSPPAAAQTPKAEELIARASAYVHDFVGRFSNVVAEERHEQEITEPRRKRVLVGDFLLVRYPGDELWQAFRDVREVDGKPVGSGQEARILRLFTEPSDNTLRRARELAEVSARYNLLDIGTLNNPLLAMAFLQQQYNSRFRYTVSGIDRKLGPDVRTVRFVEFQRPTVLSGNSAADIFSRGLFWIEQSTGKVVKTELQVGGGAFPVRITTLYRFDADLGINVPAQMDDWYPAGSGEFRGKATYGKFRRFQVQTSEAIK